MIDLEAQDAQIRELYRRADVAVDEWRESIGAVSAAMRRTVETFEAATFDLLERDGDEQKDLSR